MFFQTQKMQVWDFNPIMRIKDMTVLQLPLITIDYFRVRNIAFAKPRGGITFLEMESPWQHQTIEESAEMIVRLKLVTETKTEEDVFMDFPKKNR